VFSISSLRTQPLHIRVNADVQGSEFGVRGSGERGRKEAQRKTDRGTIRRSGGATLRRKGYLRKNLCEKDWDAFLDVYGVPSVFLVGPPNTSEAKEGNSLADSGEAQEVLGRGLRYRRGCAASEPWRSRV
jgi:hypothetical protein